MKINVFGLGYVGCVSAACLAKSGHTVLGIDVDQTKVDLIGSGRSPIIEPGLDDLIATAVASKSLKVSTTTNGSADVSIVCVGTPSNENGSLKLDYIRRVSEQIGEYIKELDDYHVVNIRSTVLPGTIEDVVIPILEESSAKKVGVEFGVCMNPEFMREGTSIRDYYHPPFTVIGEFDEMSGNVIANLYENVDAPIIRNNIKVAEILKYSCNSFHALKIAFANEIGNVCKRLNIDSHDVMEIFCADTKLNLSPYYLKPGYAFGGSCLPKDLRALQYKAKELDLELPVVSSIMNSNDNQIEQAFRLIRKTEKFRIGVLGLSFKQGTDDLRESPMVELIEKLIGKGYQVSIYDKEVSLARIFGSNKRYIEHAIPHISSLMKGSVDEVINESEVIVVGNKSDEYVDDITAIDGDRKVIDLVRIITKTEGRNGHYEGICW